MYFQRLRDTICLNANYKYCLKRYCNHRLIDLPNVFNRKDVERDWYDLWQKNKYFTVQNMDKDAFKMILPPPNITGILHIGHALTVTIQDVLARWHKMKGHPVVWVPGFDHAGIATQVVLEKYIYKTKGISKTDLGREQFLSLIWQWKSEKEIAIKDQLKTLGAGLDWSKEYFTMSKNHNHGVTEAFVTLNERNMLYRDKALVNWSPALRSTISDIEVEFLELTKETDLEVPGYKKKVKFGRIVEVAYQLKDSKNKLTVATTRPETIPGDVAIAVHPDDTRHNQYIGQYVWHPFRNIYIPVIGDTSVNMIFGTGAVKITPAHDRLDYIIAKRHGLNIIDVIDENGNMTVAAKQYEGLPRFIAREKILNDFVNKDIINNIRSHEMVIPQCSRSGDVIEYLLKEQWFVECKSMAEKAVEAVQNGTLKIDPNFHEELWFDWLRNIRDWCVSRQLWWGHQIPAYRIANERKDEWIVARSEQIALSLAQEKYGPNVKLHQDDDVLDTWFSSALLPFSAMGWPNNVQDYERYYPLTLMETGHDILFFWVARMVMLGIELTRHLPFKEILLHGVLCDAKGKKVSKSLGNVVSPDNIINGITLQDLNEQAKASHGMGILSKSELERTLKMNKATYPNGIPECGADALRLTLCSHNIKNRKVTFNIIECQTNRSFCNKIWQVSRYILLMANKDNFEKPETLTVIDLWILSRLSSMVTSVNKAFTERNFHKAVIAIKDFLYYEFCDFYVEGTKLGFNSNDSFVAKSHTYALTTCLEVSLRILAPFTPYLSDYLYSVLSKNLPNFVSLPSLLEASYPAPEKFENLRDKSLEERMNNVINLTLEIRKLMANVSRKCNPEVQIVMNNVDDREFFNTNVNLIKSVTKIWNTSIYLKTDYCIDPNSVHSSTALDCDLFLFIQDKQMSEILKQNIEKQKTSTEKILKRNSAFIE